MDAKILVSSAWIDEVDLAGLVQPNDSGTNALAGSCAFRGPTDDTTYLQIGLNTHCSDILKADMASKDGPLAYPIHIWILALRILVKKRVVFI